MPYCQHFPCCFQVTNTILPAFSLLHPSYKYNTASIFSVASKLHMPAFSPLHPSYTCQHFPCCFQVTHASIFPVAAKLYMPAFSLLHPSYTCYPTTFPVSAKLYMPPLSMLHPSYTCQHLPCPKATHTINVSSVTSTATRNRKLLHNNLIKLVELVNSKSVIYMTQEI